MFSRLREDIGSVFDRDPAARTTWEVLTCYPGIHAVTIYRLSHGFWVRGFLLAGALYLPSRAFIDRDRNSSGATIGRRFFIDHGMVVIGETAVIGDDVTLYHGVTLGERPGSRASVTRRLKMAWWLVPVRRSWGPSRSEPGQKSARMRWW